MILASGSPRRASILASLGISFEVFPADVDEAVLPHESPERHVERLSRSKAQWVGARFPERLVLGGDTIVTLDGEILGKPENRGQAEEMLLRLQGRTHRVMSGLTVVTPKGGEDAHGVFSGASVTAVTFRRVPATHIRAYVRTGEPLDKAGAYGIQGMGATFVEKVEGDYSGVVGLPVSLLVRLLERAGRPYEFPAQTPESMSVSLETTAGER